MDLRMLLLAAAWDAALGTCDHAQLNHSTLNRIQAPYPRIKRMETGGEVTSKVKPKARAQFVDSFPMFLPLCLSEKRQANHAI